MNSEIEAATGGEVKYVLEATEVMIKNGIRLVNISPNEQKRF